MHVIQHSGKQHLSHQHISFINIFSSSNVFTSDLHLMFLINVISQALIGCSGVTYDCSCSGDVCEAVRHARTIRKEIRRAQSMDSSELYSYAKELRVPYELLKKTAEMGRLPVVNFAAGGLGNLFLWFILLVPSKKHFDLIDEHTTLERLSLSVITDINCFVPMMINAVKTMKIYTQIF